MLLRSKTSLRRRGMLLEECLVSPTCMLSAVGVGNTSIRAADPTQPVWAVGTPVPVNTPWDQETAEGRSGAARYGVAGRSSAVPCMHCS